MNDLLQSKTVSDNRGSQESTHTESHTVMSQNNATENSKNNGQSYVSAAKTTPQTCFPKREQAIVIHAVEQCKLYDYVKSISDIVGSRNIIFASRISNNRICIYLSSTKVVDDLLSSHDKITIQNIDLTIRRLINPAKRIIISNVSPTIPHEVIEMALKDSGIKLASPLSFLRAGLQDEEFNHILSFRRQVYISPSQDNEPVIQSTMLIPYEDTIYRIFLSADNMECFLCKERGHISSTCPRANQAFPELKTTQDLPKKRPASSSSPAPSESTAVETNDKQTNDPSVFTFVPPQPIQPKINNTHQINRAKKKLKSGNSETNDNNLQQLQLIKELIMKSPTEYSISYENFKSFFENSFGNPDPLSEARRYTNDVVSLLNTIKNLYSNLKDRTLRNRFTRISKKLKKQLEEEGIETDSLTSMTSQNSQTETDTCMETFDDPQDNALIHLS